MKSHLIAFLIGAVVAFAAAWLVQGWRSDAAIAKKDRAMEAQRAELADAATEQVRHVLKAERNQRAQVDQALADAQKRESALRGAVAAVRAERNRLRDASAAAVRMSSESHAACLDRVTAFREVFDQCAARYGELAETADRHASDVQTLIEAWPRSVPVPRMADSPASTPTE